MSTRLILKAVFVASIILGFSGHAFAQNRGGCSHGSNGTSSMRGSPASYQRMMAQQAYYNQLQLAQLRANQMQGALLNAAPVQGQQQAQFLAAQQAARNQAVQLQGNR